MPSRCAVRGCQNDTRHPERMKVMPHVKVYMGDTDRVMFYRCKPKHRSKWRRLINRVNYKVNSNTVVCSNHFEYGQPRETAQHPTKYLKGYNTTTPSRPPPRQRDEPGPPRKKHRGKLTHPQDNHDAPLIPGEPLQRHVSPTPEASKTGFHNDHNKYTLNSEVPADDESCQRTCSVPRPCLACETQVQKLRYNIGQLQKQLKDLQEKGAGLTHIEQESKHQDLKSKRFTIADIKKKDNLMKLYTGISSYKVFKWIYDHVKEKMNRLHYYRGKTSHSMKRWQKTKANKPGRKRKLSKKDELLLTFMKLRLNLVDEDLAFRFGISASVVSSTLSTLLAFLAVELGGLIYWPSRDALQRHFPQCFKKHGNVRAVIDCTEVQTQRPSQSDVNSKLYSDYKQRHTYKVLIAFTPAGSISYISPAAGGDMSDVDLVRRSGILEMLEKGDVVLADKGFKDKSDFLLRGCKLIIPEFGKKGQMFSEHKNITNAAVSNSRIHVERLIGRIKEFRILKGDFPLLKSDIVDHVFCVCGALVNLQGILVPA